MKKYSLLLIILIILLISSILQTPKTFAQEACIGACPRGTTLRGTETCFADRDPRPLLIESLTCSDPNKTPTTTNISEIDSCTCNLKDAANTSGGGLRCQLGSETVTIDGTGIMTAIGCIPTEPQALVEGILRYGTLAAGGVAFLLMILAALQMITAEGNPEAIKTSQEKFYSAIIGLLLIIFSVLLMQVIGMDLLGLKNFGR